MQQNRNNITTYPHCKVPIHRGSSTRSHDRRQRVGHLHLLLCSGSRTRTFLLLRCHKLCHTWCGSGQKAQSAVTIKFENGVLLFGFLLRRGSGESHLDDLTEGSHLNTRGIRRVVW